MRHIVMVALLVTPLGASGQSSWIRVNQLGYLPEGPKAAVYATTADDAPPGEFALVERLTGRAVWTSRAVSSHGAYGPFRGTWRLDFSSFTSPGVYIIRCGPVDSPPVRISPAAYRGTADTLLLYMRQQRCGDNPYLNDSCHTRDGFVIYHDSLRNAFVDVVGGWHDASDYLQYVTTSATATFQMLEAYRRAPESFADVTDASGRPGSNGLPDVLDEAVWGLRWLLKMDPRGPLMFNQIADDRDHRGFRLPTEDTVSYGRGRERPVYHCTGLPQGLFAYQNRSTGLASTAGKFAAAFAAGALVLGPTDSTFRALFLERAEEAYRTGMEHPGVCQTAPCQAPYFYEEENWVDDMELAAMALYRLTGADTYRTQALAFAVREPVTPWMRDNGARHYQWYPFLNFGHVLLGEGGEKEAADFLRSGLAMIQERASASAFRFGIPFIWCSNNLASATLTQARLYREMTRDSSFLAMEGALRDWLFGCNPWGTSMVVGLPAGGDTPADPHSAFTHVHGYPITGGLVDGPVAGSVFGSLRGVHLSRPDPYEAFQSELAVYHDDWADYSTNEPTMDGTAGLIAPLASLAREGAARDPYHRALRDHGGIVRMDTTERAVYLCFTGHEFADGGERVASTLGSLGVPASFFFTGDFYRRPEHRTLVHRLRRDGHYLGAHSDRHLLYASWDRRDSTLVTRGELEADIAENVRAMAALGIPPEEARVFMPPYEWYNRTIAAWCEDLGMTLVSFTPGTTTNADYTTPGMANYRSAREIERGLLAVEEQRGLNGAILLMHIGADPARPDRLYDRLDDILAKMRDRGYRFERFR